MIKKLNYIEEQKKFTLKLLEEIVIWNHSKDFDGMCLHL